MHSYATQFSSIISDAMLQKFERFQPVTRISNFRMLEIDVFCDKNGY
jgi:MFS-type transporter involved in bile tolerance (Atg22 family)